MVTISRRGAGRLLFAGSTGFLVARDQPAATRKINSVVQGVQIGSQSYSFRDLPSLAAILEAFRKVGLGECELWEGQIETHNHHSGHLLDSPPIQTMHLKREDLRKWRLNVPLTYFRQIREQFDRTGILLYAYDYEFTADMNDAEMQRGFEMAQALGVGCITASAPISETRRIDTYAKKYTIRVGLHGHDRITDPDEFSTAETFARAMEGASEYIGVNLDIGHFVAANGDPVEYIRRNHDHIFKLHIKDRKENRGPNVPFGQGDTPIIAVLRLLRDQGWRIPANIEYEYGKPGMDTIAEVKKCYAYCRKALES
jgi:sugar phosphate isomerase/epimerase